MEENIRIWLLTNLPIRRHRRYLIQFSRSYAPIWQTSRKNLYRLAKTEFRKIQEQYANEFATLRRIRKINVYLKTQKFVNIVQQTPEWYNVKSSIISGTMVHDICLTDNAYYSQLVKTLTKIKNCMKGIYAVSENKGMPAACWHGIVFEDVARSIFERLRQVEIVEVGFVIHPKFHFLGVSPDGIVLSKEQNQNQNVNIRSVDINYSGYLIEIKCPYSRKIVKNFCPEHYVSQVQMQMHCMNIAKCYYLEWNFDNQSITNFPEFINFEPKRPYPKGYNILRKDTNTLYDFKVFYEKDLGEDEKRVLVEYLKNPLYNINYWNLLEMEEQCIEKNEQWFMDRLARFEHFTNNIQKYMHSETIPKIEEIFPEILQKKRKLVFDFAEEEEMNILPNPFLNKDEK